MITPPTNRYLAEPENAKLRRVCSFFGRRAIAFAIGLDDSKRVTTQIDETEFTAAQKNIVFNIESELSSIRRVIVSSPEVFGGAPDDVQAEAHFQNTYPHLFFGYRMQVGGTILHENSADLLASEICKIALRVYPSLLIQLHRKKFNDSESLSLSVSRYVTGESTDYYKAFTKDRDFNDLLKSPIKNQPVEFTESVRLFSSSGRQNTFQICSFPTRIIQSAFVICCMRGHVSSLQVQLTIEKLVESNRKAIRGEKAEVPVFFGLNGLGFESRAELCIDSDTVHSHSGHCYDLLPKGVKPAFLNDQLTGLVVEMAAPLSVTASSRPTISGTNDYNHWRRAADSKVSNLCTAIMLSAEDYRNAIPERSWHYITPPFFDAPIIERLNMHGASDNIMFIKLLGETERKSISEWTTKLGLLESRTRTALRRIQTGLTERVNPADGFIDAIIACDGVFGKGSKTELSFRISLTMACLLEPPGQSRLNLQKEINKYYGERSSIVHGSKDTDKLSYADLRERQERVVHLFLSCLRVLLAKYPDLLSADDMSNRIACGYLNKSAESASPHAK